MSSGLAGAVLASLLCVAVSCSCSPSSLSRAASHLDPRVTWYVPTEERVVALTIDDSPDPVGTPAILEVLARHGARATFFVIGSRVEGNEDLIERIHAAGHELGNHTFREEASVTVPDAELAAGLEATDEILEPYGPVRWFRPGSGVWDDEMLESASEQGYRTVLGDVYPYDSHIPSPAFAAWYILWSVQPGSVIVLHDAEGRGERAAETLERVLPELERRGYRVVTLSELAGS